MLDAIIKTFDNETKLNILCDPYKIDTKLDYDTKKAKLIKEVDKAKNKRLPVDMLILQMLFSPIAFLLVPAPLVITGIMLLAIQTFVMKRDITYHAGYLIQDMISKPSISLNNAGMPSENKPKQLSETERDFIINNWDSYKSFDNKLYQSQQSLITNFALNFIMFGVSCLFPIAPLLVIVQIVLGCSMLSHVHKFYKYCKIDHTKYVGQLDEIKQNNDVSSSAKIAL
jgi:hypothetical protein